MIFSDYVSISLYTIILLICAPFLGNYMAGIFDKETDGKVEKAIYHFCNVGNSGQPAIVYLRNLLTFNFLGFLFSFILILSCVKVPISWHLAFNIAISFVTNTNWQSYSGETTLTPLVQMFILTVQNFLSAGTGIAVFLALTRGLRNKDINTVGNFWRDLTRSILYILLPLSFIFALMLVSQGVVQTFKPEIAYHTLDHGVQAVGLGPVASQEAIKQLGTNGGGYFGANSAHPFENPTPFSNFLSMLAILLIPCSLVFTFGKMLKKPRHAWAIFGVMGMMWLTGLGLSLWSEHGKNPVLDNMHFFEGKEWRFSRTESVLWSTATTAASSGSVNSMHSSLSPISGLVALFNMVLGEIIFGGVGSGMYGMIIFIILTVFLCGLMVGRTPEYLQKKIDAYDMKLVLLALIIPTATILLGTTLSTLLSTGLSSRLSSGPHGFSEILYAWSSATANNGSALAGLNANTPFYNIMLGLAMVIGRFGVLIPAVLLAGSFSSKKLVALSSGQMSTSSTTFCILLTGVILIVGALSFFPALLLGPIMEQLLMAAKVTF